MQDDERDTRLRCTECGRESEGDARGWRGYLGATDVSGDDEVVIYCPACAEREFGGREL